MGKRPAIYHEYHELYAKSTYMRLTYEEAKRKSELKKELEEYYRKKGK
jgi:hypothetical protein